MTFPGAETIKGGAKGVDILRLYAGRGSLGGESSSLLDEWVPLCPLAIVTEGFAPLRTSELPLVTVIVHSLSRLEMDMAIERQREFNYYLELANDRARIAIKSISLVPSPQPLPLSAHFLHNMHSGPA